jgi:hypothetical protein
LVSILPLVWSRGVHDVRVIRYDDRNVRTLRILLSTGPTVVIRHLLTQRQLCRVSWKLQRSEVYPLQLLAKNRSHPLHLYERQSLRVFKKG